MKLQSVAISLGVILLMVVGSLWFLQNYELKKIDDYTGYRGEARTNQLFAARLFLKRMGIPTQRVDGLTSLPTIDTVIVLDTERYTMTPEKIQKLLAWVAQGGHLITRTRVDYKTEDEAEADEKQFSAEKRDPLQQSLNVEIGDNLSIDEEDLPIKIQLPKQTHPLKVNVDYFNAIISKNPAARTYTIQDKNWLLQIPHGQGLITLAATLDFVENYAIDQAEHAEFFWWLLHSNDANFKQVWLINQDNLPALSKLLITYAWPVLIMASILLLAIFWALIPRFGSFIPEPFPERRRILEHIKASGLFMWKQQPDGKAQLVASTRQALHQTARLHLPNWQWLEPAQQTEQLAEYLQLTPEKYQSLHQLLNAQELPEADFVYLVQLANKLRKTK